jgi:hypothetical protein
LGLPSINAKSKWDYAGRDNHRESKLESIPLGNNVSCYRSGMRMVRSMVITVYSTDLQAYNGFQHACATTSNHV